MNAIPDWLLRAETIALEEASKSPCRSKRGVAIMSPVIQLAYVAHNGPPLDGCPGRAVCAGNCGQRSVHAETRALRKVTLLGPLELVHVELSPVGGTVACSGPSCLPCAKEIADARFIAGVWLFEEAECKRGPGGWRRYSPGEFYRASLKRAGLGPLA